MTNSSAIALSIDKLDVINVGIHASDVAHISLVGHPRDVLKLEDYINERTKRKKPAVQLSLDLGPYLPSR